MAGRSISSWVASLLLAVAMIADAREWTYQDSKVAGQFVERRGDHILVVEGGVTNELAIEQLSSKDQAFVERLTAERRWTNQAGKQIFAAFVRRTADHVTISKDGKEFTIPVASLCDADQSYLNRRYGVVGSSAAAGATTLAPTMAESPTTSRTMSTTTSAASGETDSRTWALKDGRVIEGSFLRFEDPFVWIQTPSGATQVPIHALTDTDQEFVRTRVRGEPDMAARAAALRSRPVDSGMEPSESLGEEWTLRDGTTVKGRVEKVEDDMVWLRHPGTTVVPLALFSDADQRRIRTLAGLDDPTPQLGSDGDAANRWRLRTGETFEGELQSIDHSVAVFQTATGIRRVSIRDLMHEDLVRAMGIRGKRMAAEALAEHNANADAPQLPSALSRTSSIEQAMGQAQNQPMGSSAGYRVPSQQTQMASQMRAHTNVPQPRPQRSSSTVALARGPRCGSCGEQLSAHVDPKGRCPHCYDLISRPPPSENEESGRVRRVRSRGVIKLIAFVVFFVGSVALSLLKRVFR